MRQVAACLRVVGGVGFGAQGQTTYQISGTCGFIQDLDSADGVDLISRPILPGRGRYNGDATQLVPAPGAAAVLGACGLIAVRRRRG